MRESRRRQMENHCDRARSIRANIGPNGRYELGKAARSSSDHHNKGEAIKGHTIAIAAIGIVAVLTMGCGSPTRDVRARIGAVADGLPELHQICEQAIEPTESATRTLIAMGACPAPTLYRAPIAVLDMGEEQWTEIRELVAESSAAHKECVAGGTQAQISLQTVRALASWTTDERINSWLEQMHEALDLIESGEMPRELAAEAEGNLAALENETQDAVWLAMNETTSFRYRTLPAGFTTDPEVARNQMAELAEELEAELDVMNSSREFITERNERTDELLVVCPRNGFTSPACTRRDRRTPDFRGDSRPPSWGHHGNRTVHLF